MTTYDDLRALFINCCDRYLDQIRETVRALGRLPEARLSPEARDRLLGAFRDWERP